MPKMHVYHRQSLPDPLHSEERVAEAWPVHYIHVADVAAESVEEAYRLTNTVHTDWWTRKPVTMVAEPPLRSTSVGDVIVTADGPKLCCSLGWQDVWQLRTTCHRITERGATLLVEVAGGHIQRALVNRNMEPTILSIDRDTDGISPDQLARVGSEEALVRRVPVNTARHMTDSLESL